MSISSAQRYTAHSPCPICGGYEKERRGQRHRCYGFLSEDGLWGHCTREEFAGPLEQIGNSQTYSHKLSGDCRCGKRHSGSTNTAQNENPNQGHILDTYDYTDTDRQLLFQVVRTSPKGFYQRRPNGNGGWVNNLGGVERVLYRLPDVLAADPGKPGLVAEGEKDVNRLWKLGFVATCNPMGAGKWRDE